MGSEENSVTLLDKDGAHILDRALKTEIAKLLLQHVTNML